MRQIIVLDSGPLGRISNPKASPENDEVKAWLRSLLNRNEIVVLPEIADYEVRRELIRAGKTTGISYLDSFKATLEYLPLDTATMLEAAQLWATARNLGKPATNNLALDGDMILVAQTRAAARVWASESAGANTIIAISNTRHLSDFCDARLWPDIS